MASLVFSGEFNRVDRLKPGLHPFFSTGIFTITLLWKERKCTASGGIEVVQCLAAGMGLEGWSICGQVPGNQASLTMHLAEGKKT
jgi:hypothetical protein